MQKATVKRGTRSFKFIGERKKDQKKKNKICNSFVVGREDVSSKAHVWECI